MALRKAYGWEEDLQSEAVPMGDLEAPEPLDDIQDIEAPEMLADNPLDELDPNSVPPEVRVDAPVNVAKPIEDTRLRDAAARDRRRQKSADVRAYLLAAGRREAPNLRNVGTSHSDAARAEIASQPKAVDPLERELMAFKILQAKKGLEPKQGNPLDDDMKRQQIKTQAALEALYGRGNQPKPEKPEKVDPLEDVKRRKYEAEIKRLSTPKPIKAPGEGKPLPVEALNQLADFDTALAALDDMERDYKKLSLSNLWDRAGKFVRESDAQTFEASMRPRRQVVGRIIEGGKLVGSDEPKYQEMMLSPGDGPRVVEEKIKGLRKLLQDSKQKRRAIYGPGGYKVPAEAPAAKGVTVKDRASGESVELTAEEWAEVQADPDWQKKVEVVNGR